MTGGPLLLALLAQALPAAPAAVERFDPPALDYCVGPGDVLEVRVEGHPEHARLPTVQTTGVIFLTPLGDVAVAGLTTAEIGVKLTKLWARRDPGRPTVGVTVKDYRSQFVWVTGEVSRPGRKPLRGRTRLVDALVDAGGFTARASREVVVERKEGTFDDGTTSRHFWFSGTTPTPEEILALETLLHPRDVIVAQESRLVTVSGAVARPGRYALKRGTLTEALSAAGGVTKFAGKRVTVKGLDPETRTARVMEVDLEEVEQGRHPDPVLFFGDEVVVKARIL